MLAQTARRRQSIWDRVDATNEYARSKKFEFSFSFAVVRHRAAVLAGLIMKSICHATPIKRCRAATVREVCGSPTEQSHHCETQNTRNISMRPKADRTRQPQAARESRNRSFTSRPQINTGQPHSNRNTTETADVTVTTPAETGTPVLTGKKRV